MEASEINIEEWPIESVIPYERSLKVRSHVKVRAIANSIQNYGFDQPIVVDSDGVIIKGIGRLEAAKFLSMKTIPVIKADHLSAMEIIATRIADNKVAESEWNKDFLWEEIEDLISEGMEPKAFGFDARRLQDMFPDMLLDDFDPDTHENIDPPQNSNTPLYEEPLDEDTYQGSSGVVIPHGKEDAWLNHLSMVDYLNLHERIILNLSAGKTSIATLFWCIDNGLKDKLYIIYGNVGWGIESPDTYRYLKYIEKKADIKIAFAGSSNPRHPGGFEDNIMQFGFPEILGGCWVETEIRNARINSVLKGEGFYQAKTPPLSANSLSPTTPFIGNTPYVQVLGIRWYRNSIARANFPERGNMMGSNIHFASPLIKWKDLDVIKYLKNKGCKLHEIYLTQNEHNCFLCPKNASTTNIRYRKLYPKLWAHVLKYYAEGSRFTEITPSSICDWLKSTDDNEDNISLFSAQVTTDKEFMRDDVLNKKYRNSAHRILEDALQGQPIYKSVTDEYNTKVCN